MNNMWRIKIWPLALLLGRSLKRRAALVELECAILHEVNLLEVGNSSSNSKCQDKPQKWKNKLRKSCRFLISKSNCLEVWISKYMIQHQLYPKKNPPLSVILLVKEELPWSQFCTKSEFSKTLHKKHPKKRKKQYLMLEVLLI